MHSKENLKPCQPWCKEYLKETTKLHIERIESILKEREKATILLAQSETARRESEMLEKFVLRQNYEKEIKSLQDQITGPLGIELRMRKAEQDRGVVDAKLYMIIVGIPLAVTAVMFFVMQHIIRVGG